MNYEDQVNHKIGDIKKVLETIGAEELRDSFYAVLLSNLCTFHGALLSGEMGFDIYSKLQLDLAKTMREYILTKDKI